MGKEMTLDTLFKPAGKRLAESAAIVGAPVRKVWDKLTSEEGSITLLKRMAALRVRKMLFSGRRRFA